MVQEQLQFRTVQTGEAHMDTTWDAVPLGGGRVITVVGGAEGFLFSSLHEDSSSPRSGLGEILSVQLFSCEVR